jgi:ERF superfamily
MAMKIITAAPLGAASSGDRRRDDRSQCRRQARREHVPRISLRTMGDILKEITPLLGKHGIVIFQSETGRAMFDEDNVIAIEYAFTVAHASGEIWPHAIKQTGVSTCRNSKGGWDDKSLNKCHTAARKYFLLALCQIPTGNEEDDADQDERPAKQIVRPAYVMPPPSRALKQGGIAERAMAARSTGPSRPFLASDAGRFDERNPPPYGTDVREAAKALNKQLHPMNDELPGDLAPPKQLDKSERDGVPAFLNRRSSAELAPLPYWEAALVEGSR